MVDGIGGIESPGAHVLADDWGSTPQPFISGGSPPMIEGAMEVGAVDTVDAAMLEGGNGGGPCRAAT